MVSETTLVNKKSKRNDSFGKRIVLERERLGLKQVDLCIRAGVSKTTQIKYEAGERLPDVEYLACLQGAKFDVMYILTGERSGAAPLNAELQNLLDAYQVAPLDLKRAVFGVLLSPYEHGWDSSRVVPGYFRHQILGEEDSRFEDHHAKRRAAQANEVQPEKRPMSEEEIALLDNYRNSTPEHQATIRKTSDTLAKPVTGEDEQCA